MKYDALLSFLSNLKGQTASYGIERMRALSEHLNHPQRSFPAIHVAGTNGKGSVCAMLEAIFRHSGYKTGLCLSPHITDLEERFQIDGSLLPKEKTIHYGQQIIKAANLISKIQPELYPTFFEFVTAIAFLCFQDEIVDIGIIETGLGGEFDSTNILQPEISIITSISHDHNEILGPTIQDIATAKAGIIKESTPLVIGELPPEAENIILQRAASLNAPVFPIKEHFKDYPQTNLAGSHQKINAAIALLTAQILQNKFPTINPSDALQSVNFPARWQSIPLNCRKTLILDVTHNEGGAPFLEENILSLDKKPTIIFGALSIKRAQALAPILSKHATQILLVPINDPRSLSPETLKTIFLQYTTPDILQTTTISDIIFSNLPTSHILVTGSCYLIGDISKHISQYI